MDNFESNQKEPDQFEVNLQREISSKAWVVLAAVVIFLVGGSVLGWYFFLRENIETIPSENNSVQEQASQTMTEVNAEKISTLNGIVYLRTETKEGVTEGEVMRLDLQTKASEQLLFVPFVTRTNIFTFERLDLEKLAIFPSEGRFYKLENGELEKIFDEPDVNRVSWVIISSDGMSVVGKAKGEIFTLEQKQGNWENKESLTDVIGQLEGDLSSIAWSREGDLLYVSTVVGGVGEDAHNIFYEIDVDSQAIRLIAEIVPRSKYIFSPNRSRLVAIKEFSEITEDFKFETRSALYLNEWGSSNTTVLFEVEEGSLSSPLWTFDSKEIVFALSGSTDSQFPDGIYAVNIEHGEVRNLVEADQHRASGISSVLLRPEVWIPGEDFLIYTAVLYPEGAWLNFNSRLIQRDIIDMKEEVLEPTAEQIRVLGIF